VTTNYRERRKKKRYSSSLEPQEEIKKKGEKTKQVNYSRDFSTRKSINKQRHVEL